jgi:flavin-dependent dehydrogenase
MAEMPELYFRADLKGYGWIFRKGRYLNVGLGMEQTHRLPGAIDDFLAMLRQRGRIPPDIPARFQGHAYLLQGRSQRRLVDDGVLLIGDAAGLAYPESGEGIRPAIESGLLAAATVIEAAGDYRQQQLARYGERLQVRFGTASTAIGGSPALRPRLARMLLRSRWFARHILLDRWFLHAGQADLHGV